MQVAFIVFDFETNGLSVSDGAVQVAIRMQDAQRKTIDSYVSFIRLEGQPWNKFAASVHGHTEDEIANAPTKAEVKAELQSLFTRYGIDKLGKYDKPEPVGHNVIGVDIPFMKDIMGDDYSTYFHYHAVDTMVEAGFINRCYLESGRQAPFLNKGGYPNTMLTSVAKGLGISTDDAHDAMGDVIMTCKVREVMLTTFSKRIGLSFEVDSLREQVKGLKEQLEAV